MAIQPLRLDPITVLGKQLVIELFDCVDQRFDDIQWIEESMLEAARQANATIITSAFHKFSPIGISGVVVIAESHLAIHTWPEYGYAAVDVFTCGDVLDGAQAVRVLSERLGSRRHLISSMDRGLGASPGAAQPQPGRQWPGRRRQPDPALGAGPGHGGGLMDTPIERAPLAPDLSQARYAVDLTGLVPAEVAAGLPPLPPNHFYFYPPDPLLEGDGAITAIEDSDPFDQYVYRLRRVLYQGRTRWQNVLIADTYNYDRVLMLDGAIQSAESDESLYHELLVQPAMLAHDEPRDVLIIGGGEGATLREVLSHASVRRAVMVDLDRELVELCREHLFQWHQAPSTTHAANCSPRTAGPISSATRRSMTWSSSTSSTCSTTARPRLSIPASSTSCCIRACDRAGWSRCRGWSSPTATTSPTRPSPAPCAVSSPRSTATAPRYPRSSPPGASCWLPTGSTRTTGRPRTSTDASNASSARCGSTTSTATTSRPAS